MKSRERYEKEEREALEAWRATGRRIAKAMKASGEAHKALEAAREEELQARLDQPKKQRAYLRAKEARREALKVRRQAFKERVRAAGLKTSHFFPLEEKELSMLKDDALAADAANAAALAAANAIANAAAASSSSCYSPKSPPPPID